MFMSGGKPVTGPALEPAQHYIQKGGRLKGQLSQTSASADTYPSPANQHPSQLLNHTTDHRSTDPLIINYHLDHRSDILGPLQQSTLVKERLAGILVFVVKEGLAGILLCSTQKSVQIDQRQQSALVKEGLALVKEGLALVKEGLALVKEGLAGILAFVVKEGLCSDRSTTAIRSR
ncbi:hypothetical protein PGTUg99_027988 [Puccinia graminis f. sp. tritici]|uniref:Uncharacterized protein n=1 Tax=Puccinia graminis f. sp. tritici TaxID=56615 RepID=A0A5B0SL41_PUCGR|nr:hypothetical protein PGTUg99_027988 [Puccinia graminis f. sp. tritici]